MIVEIVGPAGAGKTSLLTELVRRSDRVAAIFGFARVDYASDLALGTLAVLPRLMIWRLAGRVRSQAELRRLLRLASTRAIVRRAASFAPIVFLDQGPVYTVATLPDYDARFDSFGIFWEDVLCTWAAAIDAVICLDASDEVLIRRIRCRTKDHTVKERPESEARAYLADFRCRLERSVSRLSAFRAPRVLRYQTGGQSTSSLADDVLGALLGDRKTAA